MLELKEKMNASIFVELPSEVASVGQAVRTCERFVRSRGFDDTSNVSLVVQELLNNAVVHGNHSLADLPVRCTVEDLGQGEFRVTVEDRGEGFNYRGLDAEPPMDPRHLQHRGYVVVYALANEVRFNRKGNRVTAVVAVNPLGTTSQAS